MTTPRRPTPLAPLLGALLLSLPLPVLAQCPLGALDAAGEPLALRVGPGAEHRARVTTEQTATQTVMGRDQSSRQRTTTTLRYRILPGGEDGSRRMRITYERVQMTADGPAMQVDWDSADSSRAAPEGVTMYAALVGRPYTVSIAADGSRRTVEEWDAVAEHLLGSAPPRPGMSAEQVKAELTREIGDAVLAEAVSGAVMVLPASRRAAGASWRCTTSARTPMPMTQESAFALTDRAEGAARLAFEATMVTDSTVQVASGPGRARYALRGRSRGTLEVGEATGWVLRARVETEMEGTVRLQGPSGSPVAFPMRSTTVVTVEPPVGN